MAAKAKKTDKVQEAPWMYDIVSRPVVTEKSARGSEHGQVTFRVPLSATKPQIKTAVEVLFGVKVTAVNTSINKGKTKRSKGKIVFRSDVKKAVVTLVEGATIDVGA